MKGLDLSTVPDEALGAELSRRRAIRDEQERVDRAELSEFVRRNATEFTRFFRLGGCKRPGECVESLINDYENSAPVAYVEKRPIGGVR